MMYTFSAIKIQGRKRSKQAALTVERFMDDVGHLLGKIMKCQWQAENLKQRNQGDAWHTHRMKESKQKPKNSIGPKKR